MILHMERRQIEMARTSHEAADALLAIAQGIDFQPERIFGRENQAFAWASPEDHEVRFEVDCITPENYAPGI